MTDETKTNWRAKYREILNENKRLRAALEECVVVLELVEHPRREDPDYGTEVAALGDRIGYGALMSSASASWRKFLERKGMPLGSEFVAGPCHATVLNVLKMARAALPPSHSETP